MWQAASTLHRYPSETNGLAAFKILDLELWSSN